MNKQPTNLKKGKRVAVMHGECWISPVAAMPTGNTTKRSEHIIAHSKIGHHHVLVSKTPFEVMEGTADHDLYVKLFAPAGVVHQKSFDIHETHILAPGAYAIYHRTEYDPFAEVVRAVFD